MNKTICALGLFIGLLSTHTYAHYYPEAPTCRGPKKPLQFVTEADETSFNKKVDKFKQCLEDFVTKQNKAIENHRASATKANDAWVNYVKDELGQTLKPEEQPAENKPKEEQLFGQ